jgi:phosphatidylglycerophosphatase A
MRPAGISLANPAHFLALGFGSGLAPRAPGTWGTVAAIPLFLLLDPLPMVGYLGVLLVAFGVGIWVCELTAKAMGVGDHPAIVWDEVVGFLVAMAAAPPGPLWILIGFLLFRGFDIWKPWPISMLDREVHGGLGIMLDDVVAGFFAFATIAALSAVLA